MKARRSLSPKRSFWTVVLSDEWINIVSAASLCTGGRGGIDIFVLISGCLQNFLDMGQLEAGEVLLKDLFGGRVGVREGFVCGEKGGIDITVTRSCASALALVYAYLIRITASDTIKLRTALSEIIQRTMLTMHKIIVE